MTPVTMVVSAASIEGDWRADDRYADIGRTSVFWSPITAGRRCPMCQATHYGRGTTAECYRGWLRRQLVASTGFREAVKALQGKILACECGCKPSPCHGDILAELSDWLVREEAIAKKMAQIARIMNAEDKEADKEDEEDEEDDDERDGEDGLSVFHSEKKLARAKRKAKVQARRAERRAIIKKAGGHEPSEEQ